jgi:hypothetical protein
MPEGTVPAAVGVYRTASAEASHRYRRLPNVGSDNGRTRTDSHNKRGRSEISPVAGQNHD